MTAAVSATLRCPSCADSRPLEVFRRYEAVSPENLYVCAGCYGFWATPKALAAGIADAYSEHPALRAVVAPARCKQCLGHLKPDAVCSKCDAPPVVRNCPACADLMERVQQRSLWFDACKACGGTWYDTGELCAIHGLVPPQGMAASTVDETDAPSDLDLFTQALFILARIFLPI